MHPFPRNVSDYSEPKSVTASDWNKNHILWHTDRDFFPLIINREHNPKNRIWNIPICRIILSALSTIYMKIMKLKTKCMLTVRENGDNLNFNCILLPSPEADENWVR